MSNLRDCPPFKSEHRAGLTDGQRQRWDALLDEARATYATDLRKSVTLLHEALAIDDRHAGLHFQLAQCYDTLGDVEQARRHYLRAKDEDICPLRLPESMHAALFEIADRTGTPLVDARVLIEQRCRGGIADEAWMADHVHPSIPGHQLIADALAEHVLRLERIRPPDDWASRRDAAYQAHFRSIDTLYFEIARRRLLHLHEWARGQSRLKRRPAP